MEKTEKMSGKGFFSVFGAEKAAFQGLSGQAPLMFLTSGMRQPHVLFQHELS